jgi:hypothetical protein
MNWENCSTAECKVNTRPQAQQQFWEKSYTLDMTQELTEPVSTVIQGTHLSRETLNYRNNWPFIKIDLVKRT